MRNAVRREMISTCRAGRKYMTPWEASQIARISKLAKVHPGDRHILESITARVTGPAWDVR